MAKCQYIFPSFDLWMSKGGHDIFSLVIIFWALIGNQNMLPLGFFVQWILLAKKLIDLLEKYNLRKKIVVYVKDEGSNFNTMTIALKLVVSCEVLDLEENFQGACFGYEFSKAC